MGNAVLWDQLSPETYGNGIVSGSCGRGDKGVRKGQRKNDRGNTKDPLFFCSHSENLRFTDMAVMRLILTEGNPREKRGGRDISEGAGASITGTSIMEARRSRDDDAGEEGLRSGPGNQ